MIKRGAQYLIRFFKECNLMQLDEMMVWGKRGVIVSIILALLAAFYIQYNKAEMLKSEIKHLNKVLVSINDENKQMKKESEVLMIERDMAVMKQYVEKREKNDNFSLNGYSSWVENKEISDHFYEQSDGRFKKEWGLFLVQEAKRYNVDPYIVFELIKIESGNTFDPYIVGPKTKYGHAYGMTQFMKNTAPWIANMADLTYEDEKLFDPIYSIQLSIVYLDFLYNRYNDWNKALTAYHRGIYGLENYIQKNGHAKSWYAVKIINNAQQQKYIALSAN
jgi:soluble lytic murein transglycosylase-like protein